MDANGGMYRDVSSVDELVLNIHANLCRCQTIIQEPVTHLLRRMATGSAKDSSDHQPQNGFGLFCLVRLALSIKICMEKMAQLSDSLTDSWLVNLYPAVILPIILSDTVRYVQYKRSFTISRCQVEDVVSFCA